MLDWGSDFVYVEYVKNDLEFVDSSWQLKC